MRGARSGGASTGTAGSSWATGSAGSAPGNPARLRPLDAEIRAVLERDVPADARAEVLIGARRWLRQVLDDTRTIRLHREILASPTLGPDYTAADVGIHLAATTCHDAVPAGEYLLSFELQWASEPSHVDCNVPRATLEIE